MMNFLEFLYITVISTLIFLGFSIVLVIGIGALEYYVIYPYHIRITDSSNTVVYEGKRACVSVRSAGVNTKIEIGGGFLCIWPERTLVGKYTIKEKST